MEVELPYIVQDQLTAMAKGMKPVEAFIWQTDEPLLDGPVSRRVAVLDFDEATGALRPGVPFEPPARGRKRGRYRVQRDPTDRAFQNVSVFSTVIKTMRAFEEKDVLGRPLRWAFNGPQLLVVPRAGEWANAFYERDSRSLQFFYFDSLSQPGTKVYTSLSHDIVAHETGHAILDGIAPDLYDAITPQALALHEAMADLTSLVMSLESHTLRETVLRQTQGRIDGRTALSAVAEEFGRALGQGNVYLRSLWNEKTLHSRDRSRDENGHPNAVDRGSPHELSQVLTGALFRVLVQAHEEQVERIRSESGDGSATRFSVSGRALAIASKLLRRFMFRALDYLPPGEVSFADYGRAVWAADRASNLRTPKHRRLLVGELVKRGVAGRREELERQRSPRGQVVEVDLEALVESDWLAYDFANRNRRLLGIPAGVPFRVLPRLDVEKTTYRGDGAEPFRECVFKVAWEHHESGEPHRDLPEERAVTVGTSLVIDRDTREIRALLTTERSARQRKDRDLLLRRLVDDELIDPGAPSFGHRSSGLPEADVTQGILRVRGAARWLHLANTGA